jgi:glycosyltransferase involved in cell wall biosynthesis
VPSIVIPAHDEESSIAGLLERLAPLATGPERVEVVVVCNGCHDATAEVARRAAPWATVLDLPEPSKPAALDAGDAAVAGFPRLYLDADVDISAEAVRALFDAVHAGIPAAGATPWYDLSECSRVVRAHYRIWTRLPANTRGISGTNAMAVSREGRGRFDSWPRLIGDDYFLDGQFTSDEKVRVPQALVRRPVSRRFADCVSRKARIHQGNVDVAAAGLRSGHGGGGLRAALDVVRAEPALAADLPAHLLVSVTTRGLAWWRRRRGTAGVWYRDRSRSAA